MHIICDQCRMRFKVKRGAIKKQGRIVRCGNCEYEWVAKPTDPNVIHASRKKFKWLAIIIPALLVLALTFFAYFLRNDETFYFLKLNDNRYLNVEGIDTHFFKGDNGSYAIIKAKVTNLSDEVKELNSILIVMESNGKKQKIVIDELNVHILPKKAIIIPIRVENMGFELAHYKAYLGGKNLLRLQCARYLIQ